MCTYKIPPTVPSSQNNIIPKRLETAFSGGEQFGTLDMFWCDFREMHEAGELTVVHVLAVPRRAAAVWLSAALSLPWWSTSFFLCHLP